MLAAGCSTWDPERLALPQPYEFDDEGIAVLRAYEGYVMARPSRRALWMKVTGKDVVLPKGAQVRSEAGRAEIEIPGICALRLSPSTCIDLDRSRSLNYFRKVRSRYAVFLERGEVKASLLPGAKGRVWLGTECLGAELIEGSLKLAGPVPTAASCDGGRAELHLANGAVAVIAEQSAVSAEWIAEREMRLAALRGHVRLRLSKTRVVTLSTDGFCGPEMCPSEVNVAQR